MKRNKVMGLAVILLLLTVLTTCTITGTFAKYASKTTGEDTAAVAKWSFKVNDEEIATVGEQTETKSFNLFGTNTKLVPEATGSIEIKLENTSEVNAQATVELQETNANNVPIKYSTELNGSFVDLADLEIATNTLAPNGSETVTLYWKWVTETDEKDTAIGIAAREGNVNVKVTTTVTATQVK